MNKIILKNILPDVFLEDQSINSDIWHAEIVIERNCYYLVEANSGTGKSSLCSFIYGERSDYSGNIFFDERDIRSVSGKEWDKIRRSQISILFQDLQLFPELSAIENVYLKNNLTGYKSDWQIKYMFDCLNIGKKITSPVSKLSWGQRQRVALIRSLCQPFDFLLLDEPVSHLDESNAQMMSELIEQEVSAQGAGVLFTSIGKTLSLPYSKRYSL